MTVHIAFSCGVNSRKNSRDYLKWQTFTSHFPPRTFNMELLWELQRLKFDLTQPYQMKSTLFCHSLPARFKMSRSKGSRDSCSFWNTESLECLTLCTSHTCCHIFYISLPLSLSVIISVFLSVCIPRLNQWSSTSATFSSWFMRLSRGKRSRKRLRRTSSANKPFIR